MQVIKYNSSLVYPFQNKDSSSKGSLGDKASSMYGSMGLLSTSGGVSAGNSVVASQLSRFQSYQPAALSAVMNLNGINQQTPPTLTRNDRRALASVGIVPSAPTGLPKHRYGSRKVSGNVRGVMGNPDNDWRSASTQGIEATSLTYGVMDPRLDNQPNSTLKRRTLSATGFKTCADPMQGSATRVMNPRVMAASVAGGVGGSQTNLSSPGGLTPSSQQYMCSMYTFPNVLKVAPQPQSGMNLSVISGPAPVSYRPSATNTGGVGPEQTNSTHRLAGSPSGLLR